MSWLLIPLLGFTLAGCALTAIFYGLMSVEKWNARFNPEADVDAELGRTNWLTMLAIIVSLLVGAISMMGSLAYSFQHYFE